MLAPISRMHPPPRPQTFQMFGSAEVARILRLLQPTTLAGGLAGFATSHVGTICLVPSTAVITLKGLPAAQASTLEIPRARFHSIRSTTLWADFISWRPLGAGRDGTGGQIYWESKGR